MAAATGATALATAAAVTSWQRRRRQAITPEDSLAGPPPAVVDLVGREVSTGRVPPATTPAPVTPGSPVGRIAPAPAPTPVPATARRLTPAIETTPPDTAPPAPTPASPADRIAPTPAAAPRSAARTAPLLPTIAVGDALTPSATSGPPRAAAPSPTSEPGRVPDHAPTPPPDALSAASSPPATTPADRRRVPRAAAIGAGLVLALVVAIGAIVATTGGDKDAEATDPGASSQNAAAERSTTTTTAPVTAADAFAVASQRLVEAGSFTYTGTADATDVSIARPMLWLAVSTTVEGEVATSTGRLREVSVAADGSATETVAAASEVWGRRASSVDLLDDEPLEGLPGLTGSEPAGRGAALVPWWLASAVGPTDLGLDEQGRRVFQATIPAAVMGVVERDVEPVDAVVTLTFDDDGEPVRVEIVSAPQGPPFHLVFEIGGLGDPIVIDTPTDAAGG